jgi:hypothetical protein
MKLKGRIVDLISFFTSDERGEAQRGVRREE